MEKQGNKVEIGVVGLMEILLMLGSQSMCEGCGCLLQFLKTLKNFEEWKERRFGALECCRI